MVTVVVVLVEVVVFRVVEALETSMPGATLAEVPVLLVVVVELLDLADTALCPLLEETGTCLPLRLEPEDLVEEDLVEVLLALILTSFLDLLIATTMKYLKI